MVKDGIPGLLELFIRLVDLRKKKDKAMTTLQPIFIPYSNAIQ